MSTSAGRRDKHYLAAKRLFQTGLFPCHICGKRPGITPDHVPPLHTATHWKLWRGEYKPACLPCQWLEGGRINAAATRGRTRAQATQTPRPKPSRQW